MLAVALPRSDSSEGLIQALCRLLKRFVGTGPLVSLSREPLVKPSSSYSLLGRILWGQSRFQIAVKFAFREVVADVLATVPPPGAKLDFSKTCEALPLIRQSPRVLASAYSLQDELDGVILLMSSVAESKAPRGQDIEQLTELAKLMLKRCEDAYEIVLPSKSKSVKQSLVGQKLSGSQALMHTFDQLDKTMQKSPATVTMQDLKPLSQFKWLLNAAQKATLSQWYRRVLAKSQGKDCPQALRDGDAGDGLSLVATRASSSSSAMGSMIVAQNLGGGSGGATKTKKALQQEEKKSSDRADVMQFFRSKRRKTTWIFEGLFRA